MKPRAISYLALFALFFVIPQPALAGVNVDAFCPASATAGRSLSVDVTLETSGRTRTIKWLGVGLAGNSPNTMLAEIGIFGLTRRRIDVVLQPNTPVEVPGVEVVTRLDQSLRGELATAFVVAINEDGKIKAYNVCEVKIR